MAKKNTTSLTIRVQARGGKFLGDDIGGASVTVRDVLTGRLLASGVTGGDSGQLIAADKATVAEIAAASKSVIVTPGKSPAVNWLVAEPTTSRFVADLDLDRPTLLEIAAFGPLGGLQSAQRTMVHAWVAPGEPPPAEPGLVLELPGLLVQVLQPPTHTALKQAGTKVALQANVTMMCGCPINVGEPWIPDDFEVKALVRRVGGNKTTAVPLSFAGTGPSLFEGSYSVQKAGYYEAAIVAFQRSTGNTGSGMVTFFYEPS